ncbi:Cox family DNA-binding protein [Arsenophonus nasoniae]|uniref:Cox family DNA-binding protein n=1 Tax=Arsenophonus nasoniae TaxID=638 RepID=A0AA95K6W7_9GAMM|nr:Cox family DNA-binding protein [Arsenophonus nasoniae]WGL94638.1 Cox family DNA-binding protein [Arsenophonus nasoniae]
MIKEMVNNSSASDAVTEAKFAEMIGKTKQAISDMRKDGKLPVIEMKNPNSSRGEYYIYLPAWNLGQKMAHESLPKEIRDGWLIWLGMK